jgi:hypothetical protein
MLSAQVYWPAEKKKKIFLGKIEGIREFDSGGTPKSESRYQIRYRDGDKGWARMDGRSRTHGTRQHSSKFTFVPTAARFRIGCRPCGCSKKRLVNVELSDQACPWCAQHRGHSIRALHAFPCARTAPMRVPSRQSRSVWVHVRGHACTQETLAF